MTGCRGKDDYIVRESEQKTYHLRAYTGPVYVKEYAERLRAAGYKDVREGTEHVYLEEKGESAQEAAYNILQVLTLKHGGDFSLRFVTWRQKEV